MPIRRDEEQLVRDDRLALLLKIVGGAIFIAIAGGYVLSITLALVEQPPAPQTVELIDGNADRIARLEARVADLEDEVDQLRRGAP